MPAPKILFRADASLEIGTGHVMRCLTLAKALKGADCAFVCRAHEGNLIDYIRDQGFEVLSLPMGDASGDWLGASWQEDAAQTAATGQHDLLIVDHYALDARWESAMRPHTSRLMVIDDLADRPHDCDLLLDQNLGRKAQDYTALVGPETPLLLGPAYALLRPEFAALRAKSLARRGDGLKTLLITMGGVDQHNVTGDILAALKGSALPGGTNIKVVMGPHAPHLAKVQTAATALPWPCKVLVGVSNMAELMAGSDLAIGAAGSTSWERCCMGLPTLALVLADNQQEAAGFLEAAGAVRLLGDARGAGWQARLLAALENLTPETRAALSQSARAIADGKGAERCAAAMSARADTLRPMQDSDLETVLAWRNAPEVRKHMYTQQEIALVDHQRWWASMKTNKKSQYLIFEAVGTAMGLVNFTGINPQKKSAVWGFYTSPKAPKGTGTRLGVSALDFAFHTLGLSRLTGEVLASNTASAAFHEKLGFQKVAHLPAHKEIDGVPVDVYRFEMDAAAWVRGRKTLLEGNINDT